MTIADLLPLIAQYGVGGVFAILWWLERDERKDAQKQNGVMFERTLTALIENRNTVETLKDIFEGRARA